MHNYKKHIIYKQKRRDKKRENNMKIFTNENDLTRVYNLSRIDKEIIKNKKNIKLFLGIFYSLCTDFINNNFLFTLCEYACVCARFFKKHNNCITEKKR